MPLSQDPQARAWLYKIGFLSSALALFAVLIPGIGMGLAGAFVGLAALCNTAANATALSNLTPASVKPVAKLQVELEPVLRDPAA